MKRELTSRWAIQVIMGLITMCIFAYIDSGLFLIMEEDLNNKLMTIEWFDTFSRPVLLSGCASAIAILISKSIKKYIILPNFNIIEHPVIDSFGILLGTLMVIGTYEIHKKWIK